MAIKVEKLDHVSIQVWDLDKAVNFFRDIFGTTFTDKVEQTDPIWDLVEQVDALGMDICAPRTPTGNMVKALEKRGEGLCCLAFKVSDLDQAEAEMEKRGVRQVTKYQSGDYREIFYNPKDCFGVLLCLCEYTPKKHPSMTAND